MIVKSDYAYDPQGIHQVSQAKSCESEHREYSKICTSSNLSADSKDDVGVVNIAVELIDRTVGLEPELRIMNMFMSFRPVRSFIPNVRPPSCAHVRGILVR